jgi:hypothetical protein
MSKPVVWIGIAVVVGATAFAALLPIHSTAATRDDARVIRDADGRPDLSGIWQVLGTAYWDVEGHAAAAGPVLELGALGAIPAGLSVVDGGTIPYQPWALAKRRDNARRRLVADPEVKCYLPGIPRATYMPFPLQIVQTPSDVLIAYEFASASRAIHLGSVDVVPIDTWMGQSSGHWDGDTLVVDVTGFNDQTWLDRAGNFHSDELRVTERYTPMSRDAIRYDVTIEDAKVFTRAWKMSLPLYRHLERNAQLLEFKCVEFVEPLLYGRPSRADESGGAR